MRRLDINENGIISTEGHSIDNNVLFPVARSPIFAGPGYPGGDLLDIPRKCAIVDTRNNRVVGVVSTSYKIMTNEAALRAAYKCCQTIFPETSPGDWTIVYVEISSTGSYCHIDLSRHSDDLDFVYHLPETFEVADDFYRPFIRVTNSYNGSRALTFSIGYYRTFCKNGWIIRETMIRFKFTHTRKDLGKVIEFEIEHAKIAKLKNDLLGYFRLLCNFDVELSKFRPIILKGLRLREPANPQNSHRNPQAEKKMEEWKKLLSYIDSIASQYARDQGENAYAVLNAITELASDPPKNMCIQRDRHGMQVLAGEWLVDFCKECCSSSLSIDEYLATPNKEKTGQPPYMQTESSQP